MGNQDNKNFVDIMVDAQKQAVDTLVENTNKFTNGNSIVSETAQKSSEWYKNWLDSQKNIFNQTAEKTASMQNNMGQANEYFQNWLNTQNTWAKQVWDMNNQMFQNFSNQAQTATSNPMNMWQNMNSNFNNWMSGLNNTNQWMNLMQQWSKMFNMDSFNGSTENWTKMFQQSQEMMKGNWSKMFESMQNGTTQDVYKNMMNATESFTKFSEMWMPMWKSIQDKSFNMDMYKQWMNPAGYKDLMDKMLGFMPESSRTYMHQMTAFMQDAMKQMGSSNMQGYHQMRQSMGQMFPMNNDQMFGNIMNGYNFFQNMMSEAVAPFNKMMTPSQNTKNMMEWQDLANRMAIYNIKNAELQYMMYNQGMKAMDNLAENIMNKMQSGEEINSMMALFQEWMNLSDKTFVSLFETDEYSKLMAEVSAMQLKLKKDVENQLEKFMVGIPVATRSEMDELYKTIYDLKKQVRQMEKMMDLNVDEVATEEAKSTAKKSTTKK